MKNVKRCKNLPAFLKSTWLIAFLLCGTTLVFQSCTKKDDPVPPPTENTLVISPVPVFMGMVPVNNTKAQRSIILFNSGSDAVQISNYSITGDNAGAFKIVNSPSRNIGPVESVTINLEYDPSASAEDKATLNIESDHGTLTDDISGTGTASSDKIEFFRIYSIQDEENLNYGIETSDGGLIFIGTNLIKSTIEHSDIKVLKTDQYGEKVWEKTYGGEFSDSPSRILQTPDGGYIISGTTESYGAKNTDMYLLRIDADGNELWHKTFGGDPYENVSRIMPTSDGGYLLFGTTREFQSDVLIVKVNADGDSQWQKIIGGNGGEAVGEVLEKESGDGFIFVGRTTSQDPAFEDTDIWLVEMDNSGNIVSQHNYGSSIYDVGNGLIKTADGSFIITGTTLSDDKARQSYILKVNPDYSIAWEKSFGGTNNDSFGQVQQQSNGDLLIVGSSVREVTTEHTYSQAVIYKLDDSGNEITSETFAGSKSVSLSSLEPTSDGGFILSGASDSYSLNKASIIIKLSSNY